MIEGVDYSSTAHSASPGVEALNAWGKRFVGRYAVNDKSPGGRGIHAAEYARFVAGNVDVFLYWEGSAAWMLGGWDAGVFAAQNAQFNIAGVGMPADTPVYFAHDIDPEPRHFAAIDQALAGAASVIGLARVGVYGGWLLMEHCAAVGNATWFCQTLAWEYGRGVHPAAHLYQYGFNQWIDGTNCDLVRAFTENYGQATPPETPPPPPEPNYAKPVHPAWWAADLESAHPPDRTEGDTRYRVARRNFKCKVLTTRRSEPKATARVSGPKVDVNEKLFGERIVTVKGQKGYWVLTQDGHYVLGSKLSPSVQIEPW